MEPRQAHSSEFSIPFPSSCFIREVVAGVLAAWRRAHASSIHEVNHTVCEAMTFHGIALSCSISLPASVSSHLHWCLMMSKLIRPVMQYNIFLSTPHNLATCFHVLLRYCTSLFSKVGAMHKPCAEAQPGRGCYSSSTNLQGCTGGAVFM